VRTEHDVVNALLDLREQRPSLRRAVVNACTSHFRRRKVEAAYLRRSGWYCWMLPLVVIRSAFASTSGGSGNSIGCE